MCVVIWKYLGDVWMFATKFATYNFVDAKKCGLGIELRNRV
jgi:hypothetical protein